MCAPAKLGYVSCSFVLTPCPQFFTVFPSWNAHSSFLSFIYKYPTSNSAHLKYWCFSPISSKKVPVDQTSAQWPGEPDSNGPASSGISVGPAHRFKGTKAMNPPPSFFLIPTSPSPILSKIQNIFKWPHVKKLSVMWEGIQWKLLNH